MDPARAAFIEAVERLKSWAETIPVEERCGEWECDFQEWAHLYAAWDQFLRVALPSTWSQAEMSAALYALARDNEAEYLGESLTALPLGEILLLAEAAIRDGERDTRWQVADLLGRPLRAQREHDVAEAALVGFAGDSEEYVRRRALQSLARIGSRRTESFAIAAWNEAGANAPWSRMMALWALKEVRSERVVSLLREAMASESQHLRDFATKMRGKD
jgi:HEAT repeat protein